MVAFNVDVFVEGRLDEAIVLWSDDGNAANLANEVADSIGCSTPYL